MLIKLLTNLLCGLAVVGLAYSLIYFRLFPRLIDHYRKVVRAGREYDKEIAAIQQEESSVDSKSGSDTA